jgi:hypothetical protein
MTSLQQTAMLGGAASAKTASYTLVAADAGSAISMSNAGATTITVNTALFAAGDTVHITNLGAGVCTITAGTATVNSSASLALAQYESGCLDFTTTSAAIFVKGAGAAPSSGSMTLLATGTFNSTADITFSSISGSYTDLYLVFHSVNVWASGSGDRGFIRLNGDTGNNYTYQKSNADGTSSTAASDSRFDGAYAIGDVGAAKAGSSYFRIRDYTNSSAYKGVDGMNVCVQSTSTIVGGQFVGQYKSNTAITSVTLTNASGGGIYTPASGTIYLYGVN